MLWARLEILALTPVISIADGTNEIRKHHRRALAQDAQEAQVSLPVRCRRTCYQSRI